MANVFTILPFLAFIAVAHPSTYKAVRSVAGNWVSNAEGRATLGGLILHALVFVIVVSFLMRLIAPNVSKFNGMELGITDLSEVQEFDAQMASFHPSAKMMDEEPVMGAPVPSPAPAPAAPMNWFSTMLKK